MQSVSDQMMMTGKDFLKSHVLSWRQKVYSDWEDVNFWQGIPGLRASNWESTAVGRGVGKVRGSPSPVWGSGGVMHAGG